MEKEGQQFLRGPEDTEIATPLEGEIEKTLMKGKYR